MTVFYSFIYLLNSCFYFLIIIIIWPCSVVCGILVPWNEGVSIQSCPTLWETTDCSLPGHSAHGILQARILEWVAIPFSRGSSQPGNQTQVSLIAGRFFTGWESLIPWPGIKHAPPALRVWILNHCTSREVAMIVF